MAASRDAGGRVAALNDPLPSGRAPADRPGGARTARPAAVPVSLCGDMASDPARRRTPCSASGLRRLSVAPAALGPGQAGGGAGSAATMADAPAGRAGRRSIAGYKSLLRIVHRAPARRACAAGSPWRWASTRASSRRSPTRPTRCRSRPATCRSSSRSATSRRQERERLPGALSPGPSRARAAPGRRRPARATSCASPCPSSATEATAREVEALILDFAARIIRLAQHAEAAQRSKEARADEETDQPRRRRAGRRR